MTVKIVGLVGEPLTGKDTIANIASAEFGAIRISFADKIYSSALALDPIISLGLKPDGEGQLIPQMLRLSDMIRDRGWRAAKDEIPEVRRTLQRIGTEVGRQVFDENFWVSLALRQMFIWISGGENLFVFTDVRFPNEGNALVKAAQDVGGELLMVRVTRPGKKTVNTHASESHYDEFEVDTWLHNDGSLQQLKTQVVGGHIGQFFRGFK